MKKYIKTFLYIELTVGGPGWWGWYGKNGQEPLIFSADLVLIVTLGGKLLIILPIY